MVIVSPRIAPRRTEIFRRRHRTGPLVLLLLNLCYLIRVLFVPRPVSVLSLTTKQPSRFAQHPFPRPRLSFQPKRIFILVSSEEFRVARARRHGTVVVLIFSRGPIRQAVGVRRRLSVAEVGAVPAPADPSSHATLLDRLADHHAVLLELLGEDRVQEGVAAGVQRQDKHGKHLRLFQRDQLKAERRRQRKERDRRPTQEIGKDQQRHSLGDPRIVAVPGLRTANGTVHLQVAAHQNQKRDTVNEH